MKLFLILVLLAPLIAAGQPDSLVIPAPATVDISFLVAEAMENNPEIRAAVHEMDARDAHASQTGTLDPPRLQFMQEGMPDFDFGQAMYTRIDFMQSIPFPTKLVTERRIARIQAEHAHHDHLEIVNGIINRLKSAYANLWHVQQTMVLDRENARLMEEYANVAQTRYGTAGATQQDVLKAQIEKALIQNDLLSLRQQELSFKAMMMALLNRAPSDTIGYAVIPEDVVFDANLDTLLAAARSLRPMLTHDSLMVTESEEMYSRAKEEYLPDFTAGLQRMTSPTSDFRGWSVTVGISLPFFPWALSGTKSKSDEAIASIEKARDLYTASQNSVSETIRELYYKASASRDQLKTYGYGILPKAQEVLEGSLANYRAGLTDFLMLLDSYRSVVRVTKEYYDLRLQFEQTVADLEFAVGEQNISSLK